MKIAYLIPLPLLLSACHDAQPVSVVTPVTVQSNASPATLPSCSGLSHVRYTGTSPVQPSKLTTSGHNQPLNVAVFALVPPGWTYTLSSRVKQKFSHKVSWEGGESWPHVLNRLAEDNRLQATIMWSSHQVTIDFYDTSGTTTPTCKPTVSVTPHNPFSGAAASPPLAVKAVAPAIVATPVRITPLPAAQPVNQVWRAQSGQTLRDVLYSWAATADCRGGHWTVQWVTPVNYRIDAPLSFTGTWHDALNGIFTLYEHAATPLYAGTSTPQCLVKVDDKPAR